MVRVCGHNYYRKPSANATTVKRDGKEWYAEGPHSDEMKALNKQFGMAHGISSLLNLTTFLALLAYGFTLGGRILSVADLA